MKYGYAILLSIFITCWFLGYAQVSFADTDDDQSSSAISESQDSDATIAKNYANEIPQKKSEKKEQVKRTNKKRMNAEPEGIMQKLIKELPYEVRKELKNIPAEKRVDWLIDQIIDRKGPMVAARLCQNEKFRENYVKASSDERKELLRKGMKRIISAEGEKKNTMNPGRGKQKAQIKPGIKQQLRSANPQRRQMFREKGGNPGQEAERFMQKNQREIREYVRKRPELRKKLRNLPPEKRREVVKEAIKKGFADDSGRKKMKADKPLMPKRERMDRKKQSKNQQNFNRQAPGRRNMDNMKPGRFGDSEQGRKPKADGKRGRRQMMTPKLPPPPCNMSPPGYPPPQNMPHPGMMSPDMMPYPGMPGQMDPGKFNQFDMFNPPMMPMGPHGGDFRHMFMQRILDDPELLKLFIRDLPPKYKMDLLNSLMNDEKEGKMEVKKHKKSNQKSEERMKKHSIKKPHRKKAS
jgi:hypothetical protein